MPSQRIIILERQEGSRISYRYALWADVPVSRQGFYADLNKGSEWKNAAPSDLDAIRSGAVLEKVDTSSVAAGTPIATIQAGLEDRWQKFQDEVTNRNPWDRYGTRWDGVSWVTDGVS